MSETGFTIEKILKCLPHRYPFLLVDKVVSYELNKSLRAIKNVSFNEPFFNGHFPGNPVMPGVLILEALAQACVIIATLSTDEGLDENSGTVHLLAGVDKARFKHVVQPGDQLILDVELLKYRQKMWKLRGTASVDGKVACEAEFMSATRTKHND